MSDTTRADTDPERMHELLGAFVLGGLEDEERHAFTAHLRTCADCQREAAQLSGIPGLLDLVDPDTVTFDRFGRFGRFDGVNGVDGVDGVDGVGGAAAGPAAVPDGHPVPGVPRGGVVVPLPLFARVRADRRRRRGRLIAVAAAIAVLAGGLGASLGPVVARVNAPPTTHYVATAPAAGGTQVEVDLVTRAWGTQLDLRGSGLPTSGVLLLSVTNGAGYTYDIASWSGTPSGRTTLTAPCWMKPADITALRVHTREGATLATVSTVSTTATT